MGQPASRLKLMDSKCLHPTAPTDEAWQYIDPSTDDWEKAWALKCRAATLDEVAAERASWPSAPANLVLDGATLPPSLMAAGFVGTYVRGTEWSQEQRKEVHRQIHSSPCWRQIENPCLWLCRAPDGGWVAQGENAVSTAAGFLRWRDAHALYPCVADDAAAENGGSTQPNALLYHEDRARAWVAAPPELRLRVAAPEALDAARARLPMPPLAIRLSGASLPAGMSSADAPSSDAPTDFNGVYALESGHVNHSAAWRRVVGPTGEEERERGEKSLWIVRGRNGGWVGQRDTQLSQDKGTLQLAATVGATPCEPAAGVVWQLFARAKWHAVPSMVCEAVDVSELGAAADDAVAAQQAQAQAQQAEQKAHSHEHHHEARPAGDGPHEHAHGGGGCCEHGHAEHAQHEHAHQEHAHHEHADAQPID